MDALAFFKPITPVPRFKYRRNEGREDLSSGISNDFEKYAEAWTYYLGMAKQNEGDVHILGQVDKRAFKLKLFGLSQHNDVTALDTRAPLSLKYWKCIAIMPPSSVALDGMRNCEADFFMNTSCSEGYAVKLIG